MNRIAIVEDDEDVMGALSASIQCQGWDSVEFKSAEDVAKFLALDSSLDCAIVDPHLGKTNGDEVAAELNKYRIPYIVLTAYPDSEVSKQVMNLGAHTILTKPAHSTELFHAIETAIQASN